VWEIPDGNSRLILVGLIRLPWRFLRRASRVDAPLERMSGYYGIGVLGQTTKPRQVGSGSLLDQSPY
jgi:hypothetical protein